VDEEAEDVEGNEICVAGWVEKPGDKPISCSFLKLNRGQREDMRYTFDVSKCDHSLIYYFGEELSDSRKDTLYLEPIY
jgi:hypothetical protein